MRPSSTSSNPVPTAGLYEDTHLVALIGLMLLLLNGCGNHHRAENSQSKSAASQPTSTPPIRSNTADASVSQPMSRFVSGPVTTHKRLVIFVHGVTSDSQHAWQNTEAARSWPQMMASEMTDYDVFLYGYLSPMIGSASGINETAVRMLSELKDRKLLDQYDEIFFVTHSMGGLVTKRMVNMLNTPANHAILEKIRLVLYVSVPAKGAQVAEIASWLSHNPQFKGMSPIDAADFLQSLDGDWGAIYRARSATEPFPRTYIAYEKLETDGILVVPRLYTSDLSDDTPIAFDKNHIDIVKPKDVTDPVYVWAKQRIKEADSFAVAPKTASIIEESCSTSSVHQERGNPAEDNSQQEVYFVRCKAKGAVTAVRWGGCTYMGGNACLSINKRDDLSRPCADDANAACVYYQTNDGNAKLIYGTYWYQAP
jgi:hypothetical protein